MPFAVTPSEVIAAFGVDGVTYYPLDSSIPGLRHEKTAKFLSSVGIPHDDVFMSRAEVGAADPEIIVVGEKFDAQGRICPPEARGWLVLAYFSYSLVALDPADGRVYSFPEGEDSCIPLHRDVESLTYSLLALKGFGNSVQGEEGRESSAAQMRNSIESFDSLPFADPESEWNVIYDEIEDGVW